MNDVSINERQWDGEATQKHTNKNSKNISILETFLNRKSVNIRIMYIQKISTLKIENKLLCVFSVHVNVNSSFASTIAFHSSIYDYIPFWISFALKCAITVPKFVHKRQFQNSNFPIPSPAFSELLSQFLFPFPWEVALPERTFPLSRVHHQTHL
jgi:hypothetical protein